MADDYNSPTFNAYDGGPGALMQSSKSSNQENQISLFVGNIPLSITKVHNINLLHEHYVVANLSVDSVSVRYALFHSLSLSLSQGWSS